MSTQLQFDVIDGAEYRQWVDKGGHYPLGRKITVTPFSGTGPEGENGGGFVVQLAGATEGLVCILSGGQLTIKTVPAESGKVRCLGSIEIP